MAENPSGAFEAQERKIDNLTSQLDNVTKQARREVMAAEQRAQSAKSRAERAEREVNELRSDLQEIAEGTGVNVPDREEAKRRIVALRSEKEAAESRCAELQSVLGKLGLVTDDGEYDLWECAKCRREDRIAVSDGLCGWCARDEMRSLRRELAEAKEALQAKDGAASIFMRTGIRLGEQIKALRAERDTLQKAYDLLAQSMIEAEEKHDELRRRVDGAFRDVESLRLLVNADTEFGQDIPPKQRREIKVRLGDIYRTLTQPRDESKIGGGE